jgi:glutathione S-transferase
MTVELVVDSQFLSPYALSAFVALRHKGVDFTLRTIDLGAGQQRAADFAQPSLTARVPMLVIDGWPLSESSAIAEYADEAWPGPRLYPLPPRDRARARQLQAWLRSDLADLRAARNTEGVFLGRRLGPMDDRARRQADHLLRVASALIVPGQQQLFDDWCIADVDLALMLMRLVSQGDPVPPHLEAYARHQWQTPDVQAWVGIERPVGQSERPSTDQPPPVERIDHVHVFVTDRARAEAWYARVLGFGRVAHLEAWAADGGPLTLADADGRVHLALFERPHQPCRSTVAIGLGGEAFARWRARLEAALGTWVEPVDHGLSWSLYFSDPDGNPFEITTYDTSAAAAAGAR